MLIGIYLEWSRLDFFRILFHDVMITFARNLSTNMHYSRHFVADARLEKNRCSPFCSPSSYLAFDIRSSTSTARKIKSAPRYRYSRSGNQDMQVPTNTVGKGLTSFFSSRFSLSFFFLSLFLIYLFSLSHTHTLSHSYIHTTYTCTYTLSLSLSFFLFRSFTHSRSLSFSILLSISSSLSVTYEHLNGTISPFVGNGAFDGAIRHAIRWRSTSVSPWVHLGHCRHSLGQGSSTTCEHNRAA